MQFLQQKKGPASGPQQQRETRWGRKLQLQFFLAVHYRLRGTLNMAAVLLEKQEHRRGVRRFIRKHVMEMNRMSNIKYRNTWKVKYTLSQRKIIPFSNVQCSLLYFLPVPPSPLPPRARPLRRKGGGGMRQCKKASSAAKKTQMTRGRGEGKQGRKMLRFIEIR